MCWRGWGGKGWRGKCTGLRPELRHSLAPVVTSLLQQPGKQPHMAQQMDVTQVRAMSGGCRDELEKGGERASQGDLQGPRGCAEPGRESSRSGGGGRGLGRRWCWRPPGEGPGTHLVQHGIALGPLSLPEQHQASDDVRRHDVQVPEKLRKEVGDFRVGIL